MMKSAKDASHGGTWPWWRWEVFAAVRGPITKNGMSQEEVAHIRINVHVPVCSSAPLFAVSLSAFIKREKTQIFAQSQTSWVFSLRIRTTRIARG